MALRQQARQTQQNRPYKPYIKGGGGRGHRSFLRYDRGQGIFRQII